MTFNNPSLVLDEVRNGVQTWRLVSNLVWETKVGGGFFMVIVPAGFVSDFASTPRFFWRFCPPTGEWSKPAILHDFLYVHPNGCSRFMADALFREAMLEEGVPFWRAWLMWLAVRCFGRGGWK